VAPTLLVFIDAHGPGDLEDLGRDVFVEFRRFAVHYHPSVKMRHAGAFARRRDTQASLQGIQVVMLRLLLSRGTEPLRMGMSGAGYSSGAAQC
jgi:hypothetical protein